MLFQFIISLPMMLCFFWSIFFMVRFLSMAKSFARGHIIAHLGARRGDGAPRFDGARTADAAISSFLVFVFIFHCARVFTIMSAWARFARARVP